MLPDMISPAAKTFSNTEPSVRFTRASRFTAAPM
jgi:hypothetical protein